MVCNCGCPYCSRPFHTDPCIHKFSKVKHKRAAFDRFAQDWDAALIRKPSKQSGGATAEELLKQRSSLPCIIRRFTAVIKLRERMATGRYGRYSAATCHSMQLCVFWHEAFPVKLTVSYSPILLKPLLPCNLLLPRCTLCRAKQSC